MYSSASLCLSVFAWQSEFHRTLSGLAALEPHTAHQHQEVGPKRESVASEPEM
jgi:hypothetical protein